MKKTYLLLTIVLLLSSNGIVMAQNAEKERLKANLEAAFAPKSPAEEPPAKDKNPSITAKKGQTLYYVQLFYSKKADPSAEKKAEAVLGKITRYTHQGYIKYCAGGFVTQNEALVLQRKARANGYPSAFVITLRDGERE